MSIGHESGCHILSAGYASGFVTLAMFTGAAKEDGKQG